jgi:hypothetical protein
MSTQQRSTTSTCSHETADAASCQLPATRPDGRCHLHTELEEERARGGRPSTLDEHWSEILRLAELGMSQKGIANAAGVAESTLHRWKDGYPAFASAFARARGRGERYLIREGLDKDGEVSGQAARFLLRYSFGYTK